MKNLTVTNAWTQRGWSNQDHLIDDEPISGMIGRTYANLTPLKADAQRLADRHGYPSVEFESVGRLYRYDGSPSGIPGRHVQIVTDLGPVDGPQQPKAPGKRNGVWNERGGFVGYR
jgi:hypothetical protein